MIVGREIREECGIMFEVGIKKLQNPRNLKRARYHFQALEHGVSDEEVAMHPNRYHVKYGVWENRWNEVRRRTCCHFGCLHVAEIQYERIEEANDYAITIIDKMMETDWAE